MKITDTYYYPKIITSLAFVLLLLPVDAFSQINAFKNFYTDVQTDSYFEQVGIYLSSTETGNFGLAKSFLTNPYFDKNTELKFFLQCLLDYNTKGKNYVYQNINNSELSPEKKLFLKTRIANYTKNTNDFELFAGEFEKAYPKNIELEKLNLRKPLNENNLIFSNQKIAAVNKINNLLSGPLSLNDSIYFALMKLDYTNYSYDNREKELDDIFQSFLKIWKQHKDKMYYKKVRSKLTDCHTQCQQIINWVEQQKDIENPTTPVEKVYNLLHDFTNNVNHRDILKLETAISEIYDQENDKNTREHIRAIVYIHSLEKQIDFGVFLRDVIKKINFTPRFQSRMKVKASRNEMINSIEADFSLMTENFHAQADSISAIKDAKELKLLNSLSLNEIKRFYATFAYLSLYSKSISESFYDMGFYFDSPKTEYGRSTFNLTSYLKKNPLYLKKNFPLFFNYFSDINSEEKLNIFNHLADSLIVQYPGSLGIRFFDLLIKSNFATFVPEKEKQTFYLDYFKRAIDIFGINQSENLRKNDQLFFTKLVNPNESYILEPPMNEFLKMLKPDLYVKAVQYVQQAIDSHPYNKNLKEVLTQIKND